MRPFNILHLRDTDEIGGPGKTILETHRIIDQNRFHLHVGVFKTRLETDETPFTLEATARGLAVHVIRGWNQYDPRLITGVADLVRRLNIDILHTHEVKSDLIAYLASKLRPVPLMTTLHGWIANTRKQRLYTALDKRVVRAFDRVIAVSECMKSDLVTGGLAPERVAVLHNSIVTDQYRRSGQRGDLRTLIGEDISCPIVGTLGRLSAEKGHVDFIEAIASVLRQGYRLMGVIVGDGPERQALERRIGALGVESHIRMTGYIQDPKRVLEDFDLMVLPSYTEGLPNVVLEALLMDVPVIATNVGGTPEVIEDGETGMLVPPHAPDQITTRIIEFLNDPNRYRQMALKGKTQVYERFDFHSRTKKLERLYEELARST